MPTTMLERLYTMTLIALCAWALLALFSGSAAPLAHAATYYVTKGGSNSHSCGQAQNAATAKVTVQAGISCLAGGDTLILGDGTWSEQISDYADEEHPNTIRPPSGLSWSQPTTIKAANPRKAILDKPQPGHPYNHVVFLARPETQYISLDGVVIDGRGHGACVWMGPSSHIRIQSGGIKNCGGNGIYGAVADDGSGGIDHHIVDNDMSNFAMEQVGPPGSHAIYFTGNNSLIRGNYIHAPCPFYGIHATSEHGGLHTNVIENNRVVGCDQAGIFSQGRDTVIRNNLLENNCIGLYLSASPTQVLNNTVYGWHTAANCPDSYGIFDKSGGSTLVNNLVLQQAASWSTIYAHATPPTMQTNLCDAPPPNACQLQAAPGTVVDGPGGTLTLKPGGPAVNTGTTLAQVPTDRLGVIRPQGAAYDVGAYEYTTSAPPEPGAGADTIPPTVAVTAPPPGGSLSGVVTLTATAADNVGIAGLQFKLDGKNLGPEIVQAPYTYAWDTASATPGVHTLSASVRDAASNFGHSVPVIVSVVTSAVPPDRPARPLLPGTAALSCTGTIQAVPGQVTLQCVPQAQEGRR